ncbi:hypothetical protein EI94DRAFT_1821969 [Lactarius quietus]|nr:hypothetical protein EI94DRAFT_1821969 [Lactarius quietus]
MKRGKKHEDEFDREFNQLRITNPKAKKKKDKDPDPVTEDVVEIRPLIERRPTVELVVSEENDYGIGNAYWKSGASGSQSHSESQDITAAHPPLPPAGPSRRQSHRERRRLRPAENGRLRSQRTK